MGVHSTGNPIGGFAKLLYTHSNILDSNVFAKIKKSDLETLLEYAKLRLDSNRFTGPVDKYLFYMEDFFNNLNILKGKEIYLLDFQNLCLENRAGRYQKKCIDDFDVTSRVAPTLLHYMSESEIEHIEDFVFLRMGMFDFPFQLTDNLIINPFEDIVSEVNSLMKNKSGLGTTRRDPSQNNTIGNTKYSISVFSQKEFDNSHDRDVQLEIWRTGLAKTYREVEDIESLVYSAIRANRAIIKHKYKYILDTLGNDNFIALMLKSDVGYSLVKDFVEIPAGGLLQNTKNMPLGGILEPQSLNRFLGRIYALRGGNLVIAQKDKGQKKIDVETGTEYPYIRGIGAVNDTEKRMKDFDVDCLTKDALKYGYSVGSIEYILARLNHENFEVHMETGTGDWIKEIGENKVVPYDISKLEQIFERTVRPSNIGSKCELHKYFGMLPRDYFPDHFSELEVATIGTLLHSFSNEGPDTQYEFLEKYGIEGMEREKYCEVPIKVTLQFNTNEMEQAASKLKILGGEFYNSMLHELRVLYKQGGIVEDGGRPDAVLRVGNIPIILDFKRRMALAHPVPYFWEQTARYAQRFETSHFYSIIVQTPFSPRKFMDVDLEPEGVHRKQKIRIKRIEMSSDFISNVRQKVLFEFLGNKAIEKNNSLAKIIREQYKHSLCHNCFANSQNEPKCRYFIEGVSSPWSLE